MPMSGLKGPHDGVEFGSFVDGARNEFLCPLPVSPGVQGQGCSLHLEFRKHPCLSSLGCGSYVVQS